MIGIFLSLVTSTMYASLQQTIAQTTTTATKTTNSNTFLTYENNSTLGVKIQYPLIGKGVLVLLIKEELLNDFLVVTCTFNVAPTGEAFFSVVLFGDDSIVILLADELMSNRIGGLLSNTPILS